MKMVEIKKNRHGKSDEWMKILLIWVKKQMRKEEKCEKGFKTKLRFSIKTKWITLEKFMKYGRNFMRPSKEKDRKIYKNIQESQKSLKFIQERRKYEERVL